MVSKVLEVHGHFNYSEGWGFCNHFEWLEDILLILEVSGLFDHFRGLGGILEDCGISMILDIPRASRLIWRFWIYFGHFGEI